MEQKYPVVMINTKLDLWTKFKYTAFQLSLPILQKKKKIHKSRTGKGWYENRAACGMWSCQFKVITATEGWCKYTHERNIGIA